MLQAGDLEFDLEVAAPKRVLLQGQPALQIGVSPCQCLDQSVKFGTRDAVPVQPIVQVLLQIVAKSCRVHRLVAASDRRSPIAFTGEASNG